MKMLGDYDLLVQLCNNRGITPPAEILEAIKSGSSTGELRLPCMSIVVPICGVLARMLSSSSTIRTVDLSDCMLLSKGLSSIIDALCDGTSITSLNLKGNNINGSAVSQMGNLFLRNNTLKRLSIEWNSLGTEIDEFVKFCDGLARNHNIEELDMRYNQLSPQCAEPLAKALRTNKSLKMVDLAWNTLGLRGGQQLLKAIQDNHSLVKLNLRGNCIPEEIVNTIDESLHKNQCRNVVSQKNISNTVEIAKIINFKDNLDITRNKTTIDDNSVTDEVLEIHPNVIGTNDDRNNDSELDNTRLTTKIIAFSGGDADPSNDNDRIVETTNKIAELNDILQDRTTAIDTLTKELSVRTEESEAAKLLTIKLQDEIERLNNERRAIVLEKSREIAEIKETQAKKYEDCQRCCKKLETSLKESALREKDLEERLQRYERENRKINVEMVSMREKSIAQTQSHEDVMAKCRIEIHRLKRENKERDNRHKIESSVLKNTLKESTEALEECQTQLQKSRTELRDTVENFSTVKTRLVEVERVNCRLVKIEELYQKLKDDKKMLEEKILDSERTTAMLNRKIATLQGELIEPQRRYGLVKDELEQEREKCARLRQELADERTRIKEQNAQMQILNGQITGLNNQINEIRNNHAEAMRERDKERKILKDIISNKEREFNELKTEEVQRASQLYAAFSKYLGSIGPNTTL